MCRASRVTRRTVASPGAPSAYLGWSQFASCNVCGGPAEATNDQFYLLLPDALPGPGRPSASIAYRPYRGDTQ